MDGFIGGVLVQAIGAFIKWCFYSLYKVIFKKEPISFQDYRKRNENVNDYDAIFLRASDMFVGLVFCALILLLIYFYY